MAELLVRASTQDAKLLRRVYGFDGQPAAPARPHRIVVDAHVPSAKNGPDICATARRAGVPYLIDPQTFYLQAAQHPEDSWANLPFGQTAAWQPSQADIAAQDELVARVVDYQVTNGASAIIAPYIDLEKPESEWLLIQAGLWERTRRYLDQQSIALPVIAVLAVGWRILQTLHGVRALNPVLTALSHLGPREVAIAASKADQGAHPEHRLMSLVLIVERLRADYPVLLWQQGHLGEVGVAVGAVGYECGIGWRERCDLPTTSKAHGRPAQGGARSARPVYIPILGRSIPKNSVETIRREFRDIWLQMLCHDTDCCPAGGQGLLLDARAHAIVQRARHLEQIARIDRPVWRWQHLADRADAGLAVAKRINRYASTGLPLTKIHTGALTAISAVSKTRRVDTRSRRVA
jgi:hypothetical protein